MAAFNPPISNTPSHNYINYSQGTTPDRSLGTLFEGVGQAIQTGFKEKDNYEKAKIDKTITAGITGLDNEIMGDIPTELANGKTAADKIRNAYDQGKLRPEYRDAKLASLAKGLSLKYPDQTQYIWNNISNMSGTSPVGQVIGDVRSSIKAAESDADQSTKFRIQQINQNAEYFATPEFQDAYKAATGGEPFKYDSFDPTIAAGIAASMKASEHKVEQYGKELDIQKKEREAGDDKNLRASVAILDEMKNRILTNAGNQDASMAGLTNSYQTMFQTIEKINKNPGSLTPDVAAALTSKLGQLEMEMAAQYEKIVSQPNASGVSINDVVTDAAKRKELKDNFLMPVQLLREALENKNHGVLSSIANDVQMRNSAVDREVLIRIGPETAVQLGVLKASVSPETYTSVTERLLAGEDLDPREKTIMQNLGLSILNGKSPSKVLDSATDAGVPSASPKAMEKVIRWLPEQMMAIEDKKDLNAFAENVYSDTQFLTDYTYADSIGVFERYVNPTITEKLKGTPAFEKYQNWAEKNFGAIMRKSGINAIQSSLDAIPGAELKYNAEKGVFEAPMLPQNYGTQLDAANRGKGGGAALELQKNNVKALSEAVYTANRYLRAAVPVLVENGLTESEAAAYLLQNGFSSDGYANLKSNPNSIFKTLYDAFIKGMSAPEGQQLNEGATDRKGKQSSNTRSMINYANRGATRNLKLDNKLEAKIATAVETVFGPGYSVQVFSGGQPKKGTSSRRTGSIRHDEGKAADVYIIDPQGNRVTDTGTLDKLKAYWLENDMGSVGTYMRGAGMHLDEWTKEELLAGMASSWRY